MSFLKGPQLLNTRLLNSTVALACVVSAFVFLTSNVVIAQSLVPRASTWGYWNKNEDPPVSWNQLNCAACNWPQALAEIGFGDGDERTVLRAHGENGVVYFRREFEINLVDNAQLPKSLSLALVRDDAAEVFINGVSVHSSNLNKEAKAKPDQIGFYHYVKEIVEDFESESRFENVKLQLPPKLLRKGKNIIAVAVYQHSEHDTDLSFDLALSVSHDIDVARLPYVQNVTDNGITVRWATHQPSKSVVRYAKSLEDLQTGKFTTVGVDELTREHDVRLTNLESDTLYYYVVGTDTAALKGGSESHYFKTHKLPKADAINTRIWVLGDSGEYNLHSKSVKNSFLSLADRTGKFPDIWLMLGDNAYFDGTIEQFDRSLFGLFPEILRNTNLWSALGNHDADAGHTAYFDVFNFPTQGEAGGVPSGTENYYSFDYHNIHFVCLDSVVNPDSVEMQKWLRKDLAFANKNPITQWTIVYFHHAPYSKGTHDSDDPKQYKDRMRKMRWNFVPIFDEMGVDLVLAGHSHVYERSYLIQGHYGQSNELNPKTMILDSTLGNPSQGKPYMKTADPNVANSGVVYVVSGSASKKVKNHYYGLMHPVMVPLQQGYGETLNGLDEYGSFYIDVDGLTLDGKFVDERGLIRDHFQIKKLKGFTR